MFFSIQHLLHALLRYLLGSDFCTFIAQVPQQARHQLQGL
ncbi:MAG: hypothetical protein RLZZ192_906, partial [Pseudomonadota bacterium]